MVNFKLQGFKEAEKAFKKMAGGLAIESARAVNRALLAGRTLATKEIGSRYNLKAAQIKKSLDMKKATRAVSRGALTAKGPMIPLEEFNPKVDVRPVARRRKARKAQFLKVKVLRKGGAKFIPGAFKAKGKVFERRQPARTPLFQVSAIGVPFMMGSLKIGKQVRERMDAVFRDRLTHEAARSLKTAGAKIS